MSIESVHLKFHLLPNEMGQSTVLHFFLSHGWTIPVWAGAPAASEGCEATPLMREFRTFLLNTGFLHMSCQCGAFCQQTANIAFKNFPRIMGQIPGKGVVLTCARPGENKKNLKMNKTKTKPKQLVHSREHDYKTSSCTMMFFRFSGAWYLVAFGSSSFWLRKLPSAWLADL